MADDKVIYRYGGKGTFYGVPARDLTQRDLDRLPLDKQRDVTAGTLYTPVTKAAQTDTKRQQKAAEQQEGGE
jgi:hypothetical protein